MAGTKEMAVAVAVVVLSVVCMSVEQVGAQVHHVVGGDRGWDSENDVSSWSRGRIFRVGDKLWFAYSVAQGSIVELRSEEEYESCDVSKPMRMYKDGIDRVSLEEEGIRYFASSEGSSCRGGLKLHVGVLPRGEERPPRLPIPYSEEAALRLADGPVSPSLSGPITSPPLFLIPAGFLLFLVFLVAM